MKRVTILGCGLVGGTIVRDLASDATLSVRAVDVSDEALARLREIPRVELQRADLSDPSAVAGVIEGADVVVGAVPGRFGLAMLRTVIDRGKPVSDISFAPEDPFELDELARTRGVAAVVDAGVSPGLSNLAIGRAAAILDSIDDASIFVGGLPSKRYWPYEYRSVFSPTDVIEEYTRPARLIEHGRVVVKPALSEVELIDFPQIGTLEAFNTDGLRTLLHTVEALNLKEKTLRYPGHAERMRMLRETGFFSDEPVEIDGISIIPRRLTEHLMFEQWRRPEEEEELTILQVVAEGPAGGQRKRIRFELLDRTDRESGTTSMARTTGFPCAIVARLLAAGEIEQTGILPLESLGRDERLYDHIVSELRDRGVELRETETSLS
jgi:lysine 6-dehydrogenase